MALEQYIADEIATDHADGLLTRREALRRLALLGFAGAAGTAVLAACARDSGRTAQSPRPATTSAAASAQAQDVVFQGQGTRSQVKLQGAWASKPDAKAGVLLVHENRGLTDHFRALAARLAADGYGALAVDLLSDEGGTRSFDDQAKATAALGAANEERLVSDLRAGITEIRRRLPAVKVAAVGFCFGGGMVWQLLNDGEDRLSAAVPFYGPAPERPDFSKAKAAVLAIYAELDARVNASRETARQALEKAGLVHEVVTVPGVDHAFFNDTGPRHNAEAAGAAYTRVLDWFGKHLA